jgi:hypothetical protein
MIEHVDGLLKVKHVAVGFISKYKSCLTDIFTGLCVPIHKTCCKNGKLYFSHSAYVCVPYFYRKNGDYLTRQHYSNGCRMYRRYGAESEVYV